VKHFFFRNFLFVHIIFVVFFVGYLLTGFRIFPDYGVPIDEYSQIDIGRVNYERIVYGNMEIQSHYDRYYGPAFEVPLYILSNSISDRFAIDIMSARHVGVFLFFAFSLVIFYVLLSAMNHSPVYGLLGVILLIVTPRFFAESFYNTKDMAFLSMTILVLYASFRMNIKKWLTVVIAGVFTGIAISVRAQGLLLLFAVTLTLTLTEKISLTKRAVVVMGYVALSLMTFFLTSPIFWNDTFHNLLGFWQSAANPVGVPTFYFGTWYISPNTPWHYHLVWVGITGLLSVIVTAIVGGMWYVRMIVKHNKHQNVEYPVYFTMFVIVVGTFAVSAFFNPRSYDGWRHIYYIYPGMIGFSLYFLRVLHERKSLVWKRGLFIGAVSMMCIDCLFALGFIVRNHPNQYVYFNVLAGGYKNVKENFDLDYWGISQKQALEYLMTWSDTPVRFIYFDQLLPYARFGMMPRLLEKGWVYTESIDNADVYIAAYRDYKAPSPKIFSKAFSVSVEGVDISAIYASHPYVSYLQQ
jgi:hypothetical protein